MKKNELTPDEALRRFEAEDFSPCYLIYGEEPFFVDQVLSRLLEKGRTKDWDEARIDGQKASPDEIIRLAKTRPLMGNRRVIVVQNADKIKDPQERLIPYIEAPAQTTVIVFIAPKPDMRIKRFALLKKHATLISCRPLYENEVARFIRQEAHRQGVPLTDETVASLKESLGKDLYSLHHELEKHSAGGHSPTGESGAIGRGHSVFELIAAVEVKDMEKGLKILSALLAEGEAPLMILAMIVRNFRMMAIAREQLETMSESAVRAHVSLPPSRVGPFLQAVRLWTSREIQTAFDRFRDADNRLKGGRTADFIVMECLLMEVCRK